MTGSEMFRLSLHLSTNTFCFYPKSIELLFFKKNNVSGLKERRAQNHCKLISN